MGRRQVAALVGGVVLAGAAVGSASGTGASHARAVLHDASGQSVGWARFTEDAAGVLHVNVHVNGLSSGFHGIHVHAVGACSPSFAAAGGHLNPAGALHGLDNPDGSHAGDLPNLQVNEAGLGWLATTTDRARLSAVSILDADGSALVIHELPDDQVSQPIGGSGARIACGVILAD
jgi:Cu-Zn family superoxide dismutase